VATTVTWGVQDGGGAPFSARTFAERLGDTEVVEKMHKRRVGATITGFAFLGAGIGMFVGGMAILDAEINGDDGSDSSGGVIGGTVVFSSGIVFMCLAPGPLGTENARQRYLANYYTPERADELIREHNEAIGEELGLSREDILQLDLHGARNRPLPWARPILSMGFIGVIGAY